MRLALTKLIAYSAVKMALRVKSYEEAVHRLNTLQSNASVLAKIREQHDTRKHQNIPDMVQFASRVGISLDDIDQLSVIHVSGTKGKGSTCAYCESILRAHGYKTGFFSSPHLVEVRERIRINGKPISQEAFSTYFWQCYEKLQATKGDNEDKMPAYFRFLTIMALHVFRQEQVDVAIMEVGIGGQYDSTNVVRRPVVCGVSSLGVDHTSVLGETVGKIAWHKAGIFKPNVPAVTVDQPEDSLQVLKDRAKEIGSPLYLAPSLDRYNTDSGPLYLGIAGEKQSLNASLALQICHIWLDAQQKNSQTDNTALTNGLNGDGVNGTNGVIDLEDQSIKEAQPFRISEQYSQGLSRCWWPGRNHLLEKGNITYFIDGAHTARSIEQCAHWFSNSAKKHSSKYREAPVRILMFNTTGDRLPEALLTYLVPLGFSHALFCPNIVFSKGDYSDMTNLRVTPQTQISKCEQNRAAWDTLVANQRAEGRSNIQCVSHVFESIEETLAAIAGLTVNNNKIGAGDDSTTNVQVLCTGSIHMVGGIFKILDPNVCDR